MGYASGFTIWRREDGWTRRNSALKRGPPPSGQPIIPFPTGRNLFLVATRHFVPWLPSFSPFGTTKRQYLSTFSKPHRSVGVLGQVRIAALGGWDAERVPRVLKTISDSLAVRGSSIPMPPVRLEDWRRRSQRSGLVEPEH
jgi:hypothetical protein